MNNLAISVYQLLKIEIFTHLDSHTWGAVLTALKLKLLCHTARQPSDDRGSLLCPFHSLSLCATVRLCDCSFCEARTPPGEVHVREIVGVKRSYVCMNVCTYLFICIWVYVYMCMHVWMYVHLCMYHITSPLITYNHIASFLIVSHFITSFLITSLLVSPPFIKTNFITSHYIIHHITSYHNN